ncbi:pirin domain-containing [Micractinium conductrix]|uniref:Pirin domain-containing n=1 Tax=Micractinium conductrix TaxID=554055 RepID=A0A2P6VP87_9CHLO|nr:pirin domain-containing [Micractinium conductrix]|eukprot:PSC75914.1 pirin domain-containing [Micractinium conductrix]
MPAPKGAASVRHIPASSLHVAKPTHWLVSRFHFSFADYYNPKNMNFGALRVLNDDLVKPRNGFGAHPHSNAEIFSYILSGELSHADSMGRVESLPRGCVQYMSAGTGVVHEEMNNGDATCRFLQVWMTPDARGHKPQYGSASYDKVDRHNQLLHLLGGTGAVPAGPNVKEGKCIKLHQDANVFVSESDAGVQHSITLGAGRQVYLTCAEGSLTVGTGETETQLKEQDAAELVAAKTPGYITLTAGPEGAHFMLIEMKAE